MREYAPIYRRAAELIEKRGENYSCIAIKHAWYEAHPLPERVLDLEEMPIVQLYVEQMAPKVRPEVCALSESKMGWLQVSFPMSGTEKGYRVRAEYLRRMADIVEES